MIDVFEVADIIVEGVKNKYAEDIAIVAYYGSYAKGRANSKSDLDFFYIPDSKKKVDASFQFILENIGFDFWPISWERAENIAAFDEDLVDVIADAKILYGRSDKDLDRFNMLKAKIRTMCKPESKAAMVNKALSRLKDCYTYLYNIQMITSEYDLAATRIEAHKITTTVLQSLALLNQTYFSGGWRQITKQLRQLKLKPNSLEQLLDCILTQMSCHEIRRLCEELVSKTREILISEQRTLLQKYEYDDIFKGFYEEAKATFNKIVTACEGNDYYTAFFASLRLQNEISNLLARTEDGVNYSDFNVYNEYRKTYESFGLPDLAKIIENGRLDTLRSAVISLDMRIKGILETHGVALNVFHSLEELRSSVESR